MGALSASNSPSALNGPHKYNPMCLVKPTFGGWGPGRRLHIGNRDVYRGSMSRFLTTVTKLCRRRIYILLGRGSRTAETNINVCVSASDILVWRTKVDCFWFLVFYPQPCFAWLEQYVISVNIQTLVRNCQSFLDLTPKIVVSDFFGHLHRRLYTYLLVGETTC